MSRKKRDILVILALLLSWGQVLATPFLACLHQHASAEHHAAMSHDGMSHAGMQHAGMDHSAMMHGEHGRHHEAAPQQAVPPVSSHAMADCDNSCQFCRGISIPDVVEPHALGMPLVLAWSEPFSLPSISLPPPADHFRPPARG